MKVGIIGSEGFVGSAFFEVFSEDKKYSVTGIDLKNVGSLQGSSFDILINADGNSSKVLASKDPMKDFDMNVRSTLWFLVELKCRSYVHISSVDLYPDVSSMDATAEETPIDPQRLTNYGLSKYLGELLAKRHAQSWLILRLAGMVGKNMKKGPAHDILSLGKLFVSPQSKLCFMNTREVAKTAKHLIEAQKWNNIYNVVGKGNVELSDFAKLAGVTLSESGSDKHTFNISTKKIEKEVKISTSMETVKDFIKSSKETLPT
jgi:dTDP-4-dehydrorhamnose reductase